MWLQGDLDVGDACDIPPLGAYVARGGFFRPDARALLYVCMTVRGAEVVRAQSWELDLESFAVRTIEGDCVTALYTAWGEVHVRQHGCPGPLDTGAWIELEGGTRRMLPVGAHPFGPESYLLADVGSPRALRWVGPSDERVLVEDLGVGSIVIRTSERRAIVSTDDGRHIEVSSGGAVREQRSCAGGVPFARGEGAEIVHCPEEPRTIVLDRTTRGERSFESLEGVDHVIVYSFDQRTHWALAMRATPSASPMERLLLDPDTMDAVVVSNADSEFGPVRDVVFRYPAQML